MDTKIKFFLMGITIFILPMLINIAFFATKQEPTESVKLGKRRWIAWIENISRAFYVVILCDATFNRMGTFKSPYLISAIVFLVLYYIVWIRYFTGGMKDSLLAKSFLGIPIPLAVFPVMYFLCASLWLQNYVAFGCMIVFGIAHYTVSYYSFQ